jgi:dTDP-D-glucose 4,6-dehydratase
MNPHDFEVLKTVIDSTSDLGLIYLINKAVQEDNSEMVDYLLDTMNTRKNQRDKLVEELRQHAALA